MVFPFNAVLCLITQFSEICVKVSVTWSVRAVTNNFSHFWYWLDLYRALVSASASLISLVTFYMAWFEVFNCLFQVSKWFVTENCDSDLTSPLVWWLNLMTKWKWIDLPQKSKVEVREWVVTQDPVTPVKPRMDSTVEVEPAPIPSSIVATSWMLDCNLSSH